MQSTKQEELPFAEYFKIPGNRPTDDAVMLVNWNDPEVIRSRRQAKLDAEYVRRGYGCDSCGHKFGTNESFEIINGMRRWFRFCPTNHCSPVFV